MAQAVQLPPISLWGPVGERRVIPGISSTSTGAHALALIALALAGGLFLTTGRSRLLREDPEPVDLRYTVSIEHPDDGIIDVTLVCRELRRSVLHLGFSGNVVAPTAPVSRFRVRSAHDADGRELRIVREEGMWRIDAATEMVVRYEVHLQRGLPDGEYADELLSQCDADGARLLGGDVFLFPTRVEAKSIEAEYELPTGWELHHPFLAEGTRAVYPELRSLYHSVVAAGNYRVMTRWVDGCELVLAIRGNFRFGDPDLVETIQRVCAEQIRFFDGAVRPRYLFVVNEHPDADDPDQLHYFGLHFDASMAILLDPRTDRRRLQAEPAHIVAHEFFHNWNGEALRQVDYDMNWFVEGVTTYYAYQTCLDARMLDHGTYAHDLRERYRTHYVDSPLRSHTTIAEAGRIVLQDPNTTYYMYTGGLLVALSLDEEISRTTQHEATLDDVMRQLLRECELDPSCRLTRESLERALETVSGTDFGPWLDRHVYGLESPPLPAFVSGEGAR